MKRAVWLLGFFFGCETPAPPSSSEPQPDLAFKRVTIRDWEDGGLRMVMTADALQVFREGSANGAFHATDAGVSMSDGMTLRAPQVQGNFITGHLEGDAGVRATRPGFSLEAPGFTADLKQQRATFEQPRTRFEK